MTRTPFFEQGIVLHPGRSGKFCGQHEGRKKKQSERKQCEREKSEQSEKEIMSLLQRRMFPGRWRVLSVFVVCVHSRVTQAFANVLFHRPRDVAHPRVIHCSDFVMMIDKKARQVVQAFKKSCLMRILSR